MKRIFTFIHKLYAKLSQFIIIHTKKMINWEILSYDFDFYACFLCKKVKKN